MVLSFDFRNPDYSAVFARRAEKLKAIRENPDCLPALKAYYKTHPADFINDWGMTFDPRNAEIGLPTTIPFLLFPKQEEWLGWLYERWQGREDGLTEKSRDMGLSWLCVGAAVHMFLFYPGTVVGFGSRKEEYVDNTSDPKSLFWKARQFISMLPVEFRPAGWNEKKHAPFMKIQNVENGAMIVGEAGDNIGRGARTSIYFKDESAFYERPEIIEAALSQTSNCRIDVSTPNGSGNPFYRRRHSGKTSIFTFHWRDDPRKDEAWYKEQCGKLDPVVVAQEIDIDYDASTNDAYIPGPLVEAAQSNSFMDVEPIGPLQLGVDVARFGDDKTCLVLRQGRVVFWVEEFTHMDTMAVAGLVRDRVTSSPNRIEQVAVDVIGLGAGVVDRLLEFPETKDITIGVNSATRLSDGRNFNTRAAIWRSMLDWLKDSPVSLPRVDGLKAELCALKYTYRNGVLLIESKEDAKKRGVKSPNKSDALALTFAAPVTQQPGYTSYHVPNTMDYG
ncbi:hypothetical protein EC843_101684 [Buttiauxella sp. JUb87]|uniref:TerL protein n=1 Tax=Buttiauxella sp. JUb87 TaxID=2485129 RepID=UPI00105E5352|nr:TerL protein [Buttiauxella sp. JUb87]TDN54638.1 hypothetical protein EC843_101684 [Buttiauxella sp. JUb87]